MLRFHIFENEKETCYAFAGWLADLVKETLEKQDRFAIALSGGDLPRFLFQILATEFVDAIDWQKLHVFWAEEKFVTVTNEKEHKLMGLKGCINNVPVPENQVHTIRTDVSPQEAAEQYENTLRTFFEGEQKTFDLVVLGMGEYGNVLSLLPNNEQNNYTDTLVMPVYDKQADLYKITLTVSAINASAVTALLVTGKRKEEVVQRVLNGKYDPEKLPAQFIVAASKAVHWFLDKGSAGKLIRPTS